MVDSVRPQKAEPKEVGPHRHRMTRVERAKRKRAANRRRHRRVAGMLAVGLLAVVVVAAVVLGGRLWHTLWGGGDDYTGRGEPDIMIQIKAGDSSPAIREPVPDHRLVRTVQ